MGTAFLAGGVFHASQTFSREAIAVHCALLLLSVIATLLPTMLVMTRTQSNAGRPGFGGEDVYPIGSSSLILSRIESLMMFGCYILFLMFQLCTHKHLYEGEYKYRHWVWGFKCGREVKCVCGRQSRQMAWVVRVMVVGTDDTNLP